MRRESESIAVDHPADNARSVSATVVFSRGRLAPWLWTLFGSAIALQGTLTAGWFLLIEPASPAALQAVCVGVAGFLVLVGLYFAAHAAHRLRDRRDPIVIGPAGLHDRLVSERPIAWAHVSGMRFVRGRGRSLVFEVAPEGAAAAGVQPLARLMAPFNRALGLPGYAFHPMGTKATLDAIVAAARVYVPVAGE